MSDMILLEGGRVLDPSQEMEKKIERVIFEKFASEALQRGQSLLATAAWDLVYRWYDLPEHRGLADRLQSQAAAALDLLDPESRKKAYEAILAAKEEEAAGE